MNNCIKIFIKNKKLNTVINDFTGFETESFVDFINNLKYHILNDDCYYDINIEDRVPKKLQEMIIKYATRLYNEKGVNGGFIHA